MPKDACKPAGYSATTKMSFASASSRADGVMMVFFPTMILEFASTAARTSSSQTKPTGLVSFVSTFGFCGSSSVYEDNGGAAGGVTGVTETGAGWGAVAVGRRPSHLSTTCSIVAREPAGADAAATTATSRTP